MFNSIMFHHFHDDGQFIKQQGSISEREFDQVLDLLEESYEILEPDFFIRQVVSGNLQANQIALTFDDGLKCQHAIARPLLEKRGLKAFFFIYSAIFDSAFRMDLGMEILRDFRHRCFGDIEEFYDAFFKCKGVASRVSAAAEYVKSSKFLSDREYLSFNDRVYRYLRDNVLSPQVFKSAHRDLMQLRSYNVRVARESVFMNEMETRELISTGHEVGLHSYDHPTAINGLSIEAQKAQYSRNYDDICSLFGSKPRSVSYPNGQANRWLASFFTDAGIEVGFMALNGKGGAAEPLYMPRSNHMQVINEIRINQQA